MGNSALRRQFGRLLKEKGFSHRFCNGKKERYMFFPAEELRLNIFSLSLKQGDTIWSGFANERFHCIDLWYSPLHSRSRKKKYLLEVCIITSIGGTRRFGLKPKSKQEVQKLIDEHLLTVMETLAKSPSSRLLNRDRKLLNRHLAGLALIDDDGVLYE